MTISALQANRIVEDDAPLTPVYGVPINHPGAWKVADFKTPADYTIEFSATQLRDIEHAIRQIRAAGLGRVFTRLRQQDLELVQLGPEQPAAHTLRGPDSDPLRKRLRSRLLF